MLEERNVKVITIGRGSSSDLQWSVEEESFPDYSQLEGVDAVVHLAGENIASGDGFLSVLGRWSPAKKQAILESRVKGTRLIVSSIARLKSKPKLFFSMSGLGYYGFEDGSSKEEEEVKDESSPMGEGFLALVCSQWEAEALKAERVAGMRTVVARLAVVLSVNGGVVGKLLPIFSVGAGGNIGSGEQSFSWISLKDTIRAIEYTMENSRLSGVINLCSPNPVDNKTFTSALGKALNRPAFIPVPTTAALLAFGQMGKELLLGGQKGVPSKLLKNGFEFKDVDIEACLRDVVTNKL